MADAPLSSAVDVPAVALTPPVGQPDLRPLTTSELIDRGFILYRTHFAGFLLLALLCQSAPLLGQILATGFQLNPTQTELLEDPASFCTKLGVLMAIALVAQVIVFCFEVVITFYIADAYLGKIPSVKESLRKFTTCIVSSIWTCVLNRILIGLTFIFPMIAAAGLYFYELVYPPLSFLPLFLFGGVALVLMVASIAPVLIVFMRLMVTVPALALEGQSGWKAIKRSAALVRYDPGPGHFLLGRDAAEFSAAAALHHRAADSLLTSLAADPAPSSASSCGTAPADRSPRRPTPS